MSILITGGCGYIGSHTCIAVSYTHLAAAAGKGEEGYG